MGSAILPGSEATGGFGVARQGTSDGSWTAERRVTRALKIPPLVLLTTVLALAAGELAIGTGLYFVTMMVICLTSIGITYNMLGGLSTIGGFMFAGMAAPRVVISQFAKVLLLEPADHNLLVPNLTIAVYAVFFLSAMVGVFIFGRTRLQLPRPLEPTSASQTRLLYFVSLVGGVIATASFYIDTLGTTDQQTSIGHGLGLVFSQLLLFSLVLAVDDRIGSTDGKHSVGLWVLVPSLVLEFFAFLRTSRGGAVTPVVVYFVCCYVRGYRFRKGHYIGGAICVILLQTVISPFELYSRGMVSDFSFRQRISEGYELLKSPPSWAEIQNAQSNAQASSPKDEYYSAPGTFVLSRLSLIRADSNLIAACSNGFHYGFTAVKMDLLRNIPRILYPKKPDIGGDVYIQGVIGDDRENDTHWSYSSTSDAFGAFGWAGVVIFPFFVVPAVFVVYDSMFDMARPWGTVALGSLATAGGVTMAGTLMILIKGPIYLFALSVLTVGISRIVAGSGRQTGSLRSSQSPDSSNTALDHPPAGALS